MVKSIYCMVYFLIIIGWLSSNGQPNVAVVSSEIPMTMVQTAQDKDDFILVSGGNVGSTMGNIFENEQMQQNFGGSRMVMLDNKLMRDMYRISTDKVYTVYDIRHMIFSVASAPSLSLANAVNAIVNLKLIERLQFRIFDSFYNSCIDAFGDGNNNNGEAMNHTNGKSGDAMDQSQSKISETEDPSCLVMFEELPNQPHDCSQESCRFYLHCVLHRRPCSENMLELASNYLMSGDKDNLPFSTGEKRTDRSIAKAMAMAQFDEPVEAIKFVTDTIEEMGENVGLLHARILAYVRSGLEEKTIQALVKDVNQVLSLDNTNEWSIYRKAAVLLALAQYFEVLETLDLGLTLYPKNAEFYEMKGSCHFQLQELYQAEYSYRRSLELDVENKHGAMQKLGLVLYRQGKLASAISVYKELLQIHPTDSNVLISIAQCYKQQGDGKKALHYVDKTVQFDAKGRIQLQVRGSLHHAMGNDHQALDDFKLCTEYHPGHEICLYNGGVSYASLGQFYNAVKSLAGVTCGVNPTSRSLQPNSQYIKATYLMNYCRYLHSKLDLPLSDLNIDRDLRPAFKDGWAKGSPLDMSEYFASEQKALSPDIPAVVGRRFTSYDNETQQLLCKAQLYGKLMQVQADSFLPNERFNLAMGLAAIHVGQHLRKLWTTNRKSGTKKMTWRQLYEISLPYRRLADMETPILWLSMIYKEEHIGYHNEVSFYRSQVKNLRMKSYFDLVFKLTRSMLKKQVSRHYPEHTSRYIEVEIAINPEDLVSVAKEHIPTRISTTVPSTINPDRHFDGGMIMLTHAGYGSASMYMNIPTTHKKTQDYDQELSLLFNKVMLQASKLRTNTLDGAAAVNAMMTMSYYFFNLCPFSRGSASVGLATLVGMFLSIDKEMTKSLPAGKMLDMEATLSGAPDEFIFGTKDWFKLASMSTPITSLPLVSDTFPTVRSLMEVLSFPKDVVCDKN